ncbi:hypothetical protein ACIHEI_17155 [Kitasatospora sp. NPDC051984]|uniref:hypothetical protein n=1 Tax=Kitasatospora sp. NPDC051984 TaxID=3364059 RepID=UPI0037C778A4
MGWRPTAGGPPATAPATGFPLTAGEDPRPLLTALERSLADYRRLLDDYAAGRTDLETFRDGTRDLRLGAVIDGASAWPLDLERDRWLYCDAAQVQGYAAADGDREGGDTGSQGERDDGGGGSRG